MISLDVRHESFPIAGTFTISRGSKTAADVLVVELRDGAWHQRTWERGSGETLACGSGACATGVAAVAAGLAGRGERIDVHLRGGVLGITWTAAGEVRMRGPARVVFRGVWTLDG